MFSNAEGYALRRLWGELAARASRRLWDAGARSPSTEQIDTEYRVLRAELRSTGELQRLFDTYKTEFLSK